MPQQSTKEIALTRMMDYCAYQERCHSEVRSKLIEIGITGYDVDELISVLITEGFLNEERYARAFVKGKFNQLQWGRIKIRKGLSEKRVSPYCIEKGMEEIDEDAYLATLEELATRKWKKLKDKNPYTRRQKLARFLVQKGYENGLVWDHIREKYPFSS